MRIDPIGVTLLLAVVFCVGALVAFAHLTADDSHVEHMKQLNEQRALRLACEAKSCPPPLSAKWSVGAYYLAPSECVCAAVPK